MTNAVNPKRLFFLIFLFVIISVLLPSHVTQAKTIKEREDELHQEKVLMAQKAQQQAEAKAARQARAKAEKKRLEQLAAETEKRTARETIQPSSTKISPLLSSGLTPEQEAELAALGSAKKTRSGKTVSESKTKPVQEINVIEPEMVAIKGGCFMMGSPDTEKERASNEKQYKVCVEDFSIGKYEVTQAQWQAVMGKNPSNFKGDNLPVDSVSYNDVQDFINKLNTQTGKSYRLPTEAEWEYAARAGTTTAFYTGDCINTQQANYDGSSQDYNNCGAKTGVYKKTTVAVGSYPANPWGLYDMTGNVWEWTCSAYVDLYDGSETNCTSNNDASTSRVLCGGSWGNNARHSRSAFRINNTPDDRNYFIGFRFALGQTAS